LEVDFGEMREEILFSKITETDPSTDNAGPAGWVTCVREAAPAETALGPVSAGVAVEFHPSRRKIVGRRFGHEEKLGNRSPPNSLEVSAFLPEGDP
jgi:hypothetical protein